MIMFVKWRFCELLCNLVASDCVHRLHRKGEGGGEGGGVWGGCLWRMGQAPDQHFPGPVTVPEYSWHVCTVCERKWQTDLGVCFVSPSIVFCWYPGSSSSYLNTTKYYENTHTHTHTLIQTCTRLTEWSSSFAALTLIFICRTGLEYEAWIQPDKWLQGILLIHSSLHIDLFLFIYLSAEKKSFPWIVLLKVCVLTYSVKNFQGRSRKIPKRDSSYPWIPSSHSSTSMDTSPFPIYILPSTPWLSNHLLSYTPPPGRLFMSLSGEELSMTANQQTHMNYHPFNTSKLDERPQMFSMTLHFEYA